MRAESAAFLPLRPAERGCAGPADGSLSLRVLVYGNSWPAQRTFPVGGVISIPHLQSQHIGEKNYLTKKKKKKTPLMRGPPLQGSVFAWVFSLDFFLHPSPFKIRHQK